MKYYPRRVKHFYPLGDVTGIPKKSDNLCDESMRLLVRTKKYTEFFSK